MLSSETLSDLRKQNAVSRVKSPTEKNVENVSLKMDQVLAHNKYIEDAINRIKEQINKGKQYKFVIGRDESGLIREVTAVPLEG